MFEWRLLDDIRRKVGLIKARPGLRRSDELAEIDLAARLVTNRRFRHAQLPDPPGQGTRVDA